ncbi:protein CC2D2B-like [Aplochiton taeniatus]
MAPQFRPSFTRAMTSCTNENWLAWIKDLEFDPNHPGNTELAELLRETRDQRNREQGHFRLNALEEEFDFTTEEQLDQSRRFNLLKLRSSHLMDISPSKAIPLHDRNITEAMFAVYASHSLSLNDEDPITAQRVQSLHHIERSSSLGGCGAQVFSSRRWLGSVTVPFRTLLQRTKVCEPLTIGHPSLLLGYTWTDQDSVTGPAMEDRENSSLGVFITLDPPISAAADLTAKFPSVEEEWRLKRSREFERRWRAASGGARRGVTTVLNSQGTLVLATRFFRALPPPKEVLQGTPPNDLAALEMLATFVALIPLLSSPSNVGDRGDMWFTSEQCLELAMGNSVSLAVLLCNFFHHLEIGAWLLLGTSVLEGETEYVLTQMDDRYLTKEPKEDPEIHRTTQYVLWNPRDGKHYNVCDMHCPLQTVDCLVNGQNVWVNSQHEKQIPVINFNLSDRGVWTPLFPSDLESEASSTKLFFSVRIEVSLKNSVMEWRRPHPTRWSPRCSVLLSGVLCKLERNLASPAVQEEINRLLDTMKDYKVTGFPIRMAYKDVRSVSDAVYNTRFHSTEVPGTEFALAVCIHPYPNNVLSLWVFLATLVKHQHGTFYVPAELEF